MAVTLILPVLLYFVYLADAQSPPGSCALTATLDGVSSSSGFPSDGNFHFIVCSGASGNRFDNGVSPSSCKVGDRIPLYFQVWIPYLTMNFFNITFTAPGSTNYTYMAFTNRSVVTTLSNQLSGWNLTNVQRNFYYTYGFNDNNATQVQLQMNPLIMGSTPSTIQNSKLDLFVYAMVVDSPDIAAMNNQLLNVSVTVDMIDQVGYQSSWVTQWGCTLQYDAPYTNASTLPTFALNGPSVLMVGDVGVWYLNITTYDIINNIAVDVNGPNNDSTLFNVLRVGFNPMQYASGFQHLPGANPFAGSGIVATYSVANTNLFGIGVTSTSVVSWAGYAMNTAVRDTNSNATDNTVGVVIIGQLLSNAANNTNYTITIAVELTTSSNNPTSSIYVSQLQFLSFVYSANASADLFSTPSFTAYTTLSNAVVNGYYPVFVNLTAIGTMTNYQLEVYTSINSTTTVQAAVSSVQAVAIGSNYPGYFPGQPSYSSTQNSSNDYAVWYLGQLTNTLLSTNSDANNIVLMANLITYASCTVAIGIRYNIGTASEMFWTATFSITVGTTASSATPTFNWIAATSSASYGSVVPYELQVTLPPGQIIFPITVQVALPVFYVSNSPIPLMTVCRTMVDDVGSYIYSPGLVLNTMANSTNPTGMAAFNPTYQQPTSFSSNGTAGSAGMMSSQSLLPNTSYITFTIPVTSNVGRFSYPWEAQNSTFSIQFALAINNYVVNSSFNGSYPFINGTPYWSNVIVTYGGNNIWSTISLLTVSNTPLGTAPNVSYNIANIYPNRAVNMGETVNFDLSMITPPGSATAFNISISAPPGFSVVRISYDSRGVNFPCLCQPTYTYSSNTGSYFSYDGGFNGNTGSSYTNVLSNVGFGSLTMSNPANVAANSMVASVVVLLRGDALVSAGTTYTITYTIAQIGGSTYVGMVNVTVNPTVFSDSLNQSTVVTMAVTNNMTTYPRGGAVDVAINVTTYPLSLGVYTLAVTASYNLTGGFSAYTSYPPSNTPMVQNIWMMSAGSNLPTANNMQLINGTLLNQPQNISSPSFDIQSVASVSSPFPINNIGYPERVLQNNIINGTSWLVQRNMMTFECIICLPAYLRSLTSMNTQFTISLVKNGTSLISVSTVPQAVTVSDAPVLSGAAVVPSMSVTPTNASAPYFVNSNFTWMINITLMAQVTIDLRITIRSPVYNTSSYKQSLLSFFNPRVTYQGTNVPCPLTLKVANTSSFSNQQNDTMVISFYLTNTQLTTRNAWRTYQYGFDDTIIIMFDGTLSDAPLTNPNFTVTLNSSLMSSALTVTVGNLSTLCNPPGDSCAPLLLYNSTSNVTNSTMPTNPIQLSTTIWHSIRSHADAWNVVVRHYLPPFISVAISGVSSNRTTSISINAQNVLTISYFGIGLLETATISISGVLDPNRTLPFGMLSTHCVIPVDINYYQANKTLTPYPNNFTSFYTGFQLIEFDFYVPECTNLIGMASNSTIQSCQLSASSSAINYTVEGARLNGSTWMNAPRGPPFAGNEYLQITLPGMTRVTGLIIQAHSENSSWYLTSFRLQYSQETLLWLDYVQNGTSNPYIFNITSLPPLPASGVTVMLPSQLPINAMYLRLIPLSNSGGTYSHPVRMEILGCLSSTNPSPCTLPAPVQQPAIDYVERSYLLTSDTKVLYACVLSGIGGIPSCSLTSDQGTSWFAIDSLVANIIFYRTDTQQLYGLGWDLISYVRSDDGGYTWYAIMQSDYTNAKAGCPGGSCIMAKSLPWLDWGQLQPSTLATSYGINDGTNYYTVSMSGIEKCTSPACSAWAPIAWWGQTSW